MNNITGKYRKKLIEKVRNKSKRMVFAAGSSLMLASCTLISDKSKRKNETPTKSLQVNNSASNISTNAGIASISKINTEVSDGKLKNLTHKTITKPLFAVSDAKYHLKLLIKFLNTKDPSKIDEKDICYYVTNIIEAFEGNDYYTQSSNPNELSQGNMELLEALKLIFRKSPINIVESLKKKHEDRINQNIKILKRKKNFRRLWNMSCFVGAVVGLAGSYLVFFNLPVYFYVGIQFLSFSVLSTNPFKDESNSKSNRNKMSNKRDTMSKILQKVIDGKKDKDKKYNHKDWAEDLKLLQNLKFEYSI